MKLDGVDTPSFDVVRFLNSRKLIDLEKMTLNVNGVPVKVATVEQLKKMKQDTISILKVGYAESPRPQDFEDLAQLERIARKSGPRQ